MEIFSSQFQPNIRSANQSSPSTHFPFRASSTRFQHNLLFRHSSLAHSSTGSFSADLCRMSRALTHTSTLPEMSIFESGTNQAGRVFKLAVVIILSMADSAAACGDGSAASVVSGSTLRCCSTTHDATGYKYSVDGGTHDDNIKVGNVMMTKRVSALLVTSLNLPVFAQFTVENDEGTVILDTGGNCDITNSGTQCSGTACSSSNNNNCARGPITSGIEAQKICVVMDCENWSATCNVDAFSVTFYKASDSPPPSSSSSSTPSNPSSPSTPSNPSSSSTKDTSKNCKCSCCKGNLCSASVVGSYDASSSSQCDASDCRSKFSACPASGESGSVGASYSSKSPAGTLRLSLAVISMFAAALLVA